MPLVRSTSARVQRRNVSQPIARSSSRQPAHTRESDDKDDLMDGKFLRELREMGARSNLLEAVNGDKTNDSTNYDTDGLPSWSFGDWDSTKPVQSEQSQPSSCTGTVQPQDKSSAQNIPPVRAPIKIFDPYAKPKKMPQIKTVQDGPVIIEGVDFWVSQRPDLVGEDGLQGINHSKHNPWSKIDPTFHDEIEAMASWKEIIVEPRRTQMIDHW